MTALCTGGTSAPKAGVDLVTAYTSGRLAQLAVLRGLSWTSPWLPLLSLLPIAVTSFCGSDPPTITALTTGEADALAGGAYDADFFSGLGKIKDMILNAVWQDLCECTSGTFVAPTYPAPTTGTPIYIEPVPLAAPPCQLFTYTSASANGGSLNRGGPVLDGSLVPTAVQYIIHGTSTGGSGTGAFTWSFNQRNSANVVLRNDTYTVATPTSDQVHTVPWTLGAVQVQMDQVFVSGTWSQFVTGSMVNLYCGPGVDLLQQPCCPPDPATQNSLDRLLEMVTLIQRQAVPFGYVPGTVHAGLSGAGNLSISGLIGAKVDATTIPGHFGREGTSPTEHFDLGFITFGTPDGWPSSYRLEHSPELLLPARCGAYTDLRYDLSPGVVATITELNREP